MSEDNIVELGRHAPSVASILSRLTRYNNDGEILDITCVIKWKDEGYSIVSPSKQLKDLAFESAVLQKDLFEEMHLE